MKQYPLIVVLSAAVVGALIAGTSVYILKPEPTPDPRCHSKYIEVQGDAACKVSIEQTKYLKALLSGEEQ